MVNKTKNKTNKQTIVEISADYIYLVIIGKKENLKQFSYELQKYCNDPTKNFLITRLDIPILFRYDKIKKNYKNISLIDNGIESAQSYAFAQEQFIFPKQNKKFIEEDTTINHMLMVIDDNILRFPKIDLIDEDPKQMIMDWIKKNYGSVPEQLKKSMKPLSLVGYDNEILVYTAKI
jgi:hypothetical protein